MEENQMPKKRNYERYLEAQNMQTPHNATYAVPEETADAWTQDPFATYETPVSSETGYTEAAYNETVYNEPAATNYMSSSNSFDAGYSQQNMAQSYAGLEEPVTKGEWAICFLLMMIPCVGFIMMFVWAFSSSEKKSKSNFFKVQLIFVGVVFVLYFLLFMFAMIMGITMGA